MYRVCVLTDKPIPHGSTSPRPHTRIYLKQLLDRGRGLIIAWLASRKDDLVALRDPSGVYWFRITGDAYKLLDSPLETLFMGYARIIDDTLYIDDLHVISKPVEERNIDYIGLDPRSLEEYVEYYPWLIRKPRYMYAVKMYSIISNMLRSEMILRGFIELPPLMINYVSDPGLRGASKLKTSLYGETYELTSSVIMYKQSSVAVYEKIFFMARNIREEPVENLETGKHLVEFTQLDIEEAYAKPEDAMKLAEEIIYSTSKKVADEYSDMIYSIGYRDEPVVLKPPFPRITYDEALEILRKKGFDEKWGRELSHRGETAIAEYFDSPVWITGFPVVSRGFYYLPDPGDPRYNMDFNLILPEGFGEVIDGGMREYRYDKLVKRIKTLKEPLEKYSWFLELSRYGGIPPSSGWGLGVERYVRYLIGAPHIAYVSFYPRIPGIKPKY